MLSICLALTLLCGSPIGQNIPGEVGEFAISSAALSTNGQIVVVADDANVVRAYEAKSGKLRTVLRCPIADGARWHTAVAVSADARLVAYADGKARIWVWDLAMDKASPITFETASTRKVVDGQSVEIHTLAFLPDMKCLLVAGSDGSLQRWDFPSKKLIQTIAVGAEGPIRRGTSKADSNGFESTWQDSRGWSSRVMAITSDARIAATTHGMDSIQLWDLRTGESLRTIPTPEPEDRIGSLAFSNDSKKIVAVIGSQVGGTRSYHADFAAIWEVSTGKQIGVIPPKSKDGTHESRQLSDAKFDISGDLLLTSDMSGGDGVWRFSTNKKLKSFFPSRTFFVCPDALHVILVGHRSLKCVALKTGKNVWDRSLSD